MIPAHLLDTWIRTVPRFPGGITFHLSIRTMFSILQRIAAAFFLFAVSATAAEPLHQKIDALIEEKGKQIQTI